MDDPEVDAALLDTDAEAEVDGSAEAADEALVAEAPVVWLVADVSLPPQADKPSATTAVVAITSLLVRRDMFVPSAEPRLHGAAMIGIICSD